MATIRINGDQVEIDNIATEATQRSIADKLGAAVGAGSSLGTSMSEATGATGAFGAALGVAQTAASGVGSSLIDFGMATFNGTARISTATTALKDNFGSVGRAMGKLPDTVIKGAEGLVDTFRQLSGSGAGFGGDIFELKNSAAQARIGVDSFASIIAENSAGLAAFGGTVSRGARLFTEASQNMFDEGLSDPLLMMGFTFEEINENMATYMTLNRRRFTEEEMRNGKAAASMVLMATEMDKIAKLTGKNRQELEKEIQDRMRKGQVEAKIRMLEASGNKEAADKMRMALAQAEKAGPGALAAVEDLFTKGAVVSEEGRAAAVALGPAFNDLTNMVRVAQGPGGVEGMTSSIDAFNTAVAARIQDPNFLNMATLGGMGNQFADAAAGLVTSAGTYSDNVAAVARETGSLSSAVARLRQEAGDEQRGGDTPGADVTRTVVNTEQALRDFGAVMNDRILGENGALTNFIKALNDGAGLRPLADAIGEIDRSAIDARLDSMLEGAGNLINDALGLGDRPELTTEQSAGLTDLDSKLNTIFDTGDAAMKEQISRFKSLAAAITSVDPDFANKFNAALNEQDDPTQYLNDMLQSMPADMEQALQAFIRQGIATVERRFQDDVVDLAEQNFESQPQGGSIDPNARGASIDTMVVDKLIANNVASNAAGTRATLGGNGIVPNDMLSLIHKGERVLNNAEAQAFSALENGAASGMQSAGSNSGGTLAEKLDNLNQSMLQLVSINMQAQEIARRQLKGLKGMSGNVMSGFNV